MISFFGGTQITQITTIFIRTIRVIRAWKNYLRNLRNLRSKLLSEAAVAARVLAARFGGLAGAGAFGVLDGGVVGQPLDARRHQGAGGHGALGLRPLAGGDELHAHGLHLLLEVEVGLVRHTPRGQRVAEGAQPVQPHGLALAHVVGHPRGTLPGGRHLLGHALRLVSPAAPRAGLQRHTHPRGQHGRADARLHPRGLCLAPGPAHRLAPLAAPPQAAHRPGQGARRGGVDHGGVSGADNFFSCEEQKNGLKIWPVQKNALPLPRQKTKGY